MRWLLVQKQETFWAMLLCPLSQRERGRVRGFSRALGTLTPRPLPLGVGPRRPHGSCPKRFSEHALGCDGLWLLRRRLVPEQEATIGRIELRPLPLHLTVGRALLLAGLRINVPELVLR